MISIRNLFLVSCLALLGGCAEWPHPGAPCPPPGYPSAVHKSCWYSLKITNIDQSKNLVSGTDVLSRNFTFRVRDVEMLVHTKQLKEGDTHVFGGVSSSPYLEMYIDEELKKKDEERRTLWDRATAKDQ